MAPVNPTEDNNKIKVIRFILMAYFFAASVLDTSSLYATCVYAENQILHLSFHAIKVFFNVTSTIATFKKELGILKVASMAQLTTTFLDPFYYMNYIDFSNLDMKLFIRVIVLYFIVVYCSEEKSAIELYIERMCSMRDMIFMNFYPNITPPCDEFDLPVYCKKDPNLPIYTLEIV
ncbi:hypothetical protein O9G_001211 [Rozella allomycis CSF55]|uniref:Uncharacterized protein n=1 Tax=Rozella allomycis (strain CSF55) TaxID=988480 RepID=A0A075ATG4_ROZAC|nr:hypothetical protein O9G_001211 [Rozella allomycis CSF55]|eukprot:EPZ33460.1 hypothetical protein O9G_001211 [Rozella allomycis CSF55]